MAESEFEEVATVAIQQCDALEALADGIWDDMESLDEVSDQLASSLETVVADMGNRMRAIVSEVQTAKSRTSGATGGVETALQELLGSIRDVVNDYGTEAGRIEAAARRLGAMGEEPVTALKELVPPIDKGMTAVDAEVGELAKQLETESNDAIQGLKAAAGALDQARDALAAAHTGWAQKLGELRNDAGGQLTVVLQALAAASDAHARGVVAALNEGVPLHNTLTKDMIEDLKEATSKVLTPAVDLVSQRDTELDTAIESRTDALTTNVDSIVAAAGFLAGALEVRATALAGLAGVGNA